MDSLNEPDIEGVEHIVVEQVGNQYVLTYGEAHGSGDTVAKALKDLSGSVKGRSISEEIAEGLPEPEP